MDDMTWLNLMGWISIVFSILLAIISIMAVGKHFTDLQYQRAAKLNGIRWIQSWINIRTHGNRVFFALAFLITSILALTDVDILTRTWVSRILFMALLFLYLASSILDWIAEHKQLLILMRFEHVNNLPIIRLTIHKLGNLLFEYFGLVSLIREQSHNLENKDQDETKILEDLESRIKATVKTIQLDVHAMDPTYKSSLSEGPKHADST